MLYHRRWVLKPRDGFTLNREEFPMSKVLCLLDTESGKVEELCIDLQNGLSPIKKIAISEAINKYLT